MHATQSALFDMPAAYTQAERIADRKTCRAYLKQWAGAFKQHANSPEITREDFEAAASRLAA